MVPQREPSGWVLMIGDDEEEEEDEEEGMARWLGGRLQWQ